MRLRCREVKTIYPLPPIRTRRFVASLPPFRRRRPRPACRRDCLYRGEVPDRALFETLAKYPLLAISGFTKHTLNPSAFIRKGEADMTKAKARLRAKAKAAKKAKKREANADQPGQKFPPGRFDPGAGSIKGPSTKTHVKNFAGAKRGAARSR